MKSLTWLLLASALVFTASASGQEKKDEPKKEEPFKVVVDHLDKAFGIKFKSVAVKKSVPSGGYAEIRLTLEFSKDVEDVAELKKAFEVPKGTISPLAFHCFDKDNVSLTKLYVRSIQGDLTGVKGDGFRVFFEAMELSLKDTVKLEARLTPTPKGKDK